MPQGDLWTRVGRSVGWLLAINAAAALGVGVIGQALESSLTWRSVWRAASSSFTVSTTISSLCWIVLGYVAPRLYHRTGPWVRWMGLITILIGLAALGSLAAVSMLGLIGRFPWAAFADVYRENLFISIVITLMCGIFMTLNEALRVELDTATLALRTKQRDEAEARLASLESRVNPHFFFNTLNSIAALTREDPAGAERMTTQLASLMRSSLDHGSAPLVPLEQELQTVRDYLEIEQVRFGERLRFQIRAADAARTALVPRLALQTLVENSIKYAVTVRREGASLSVDAQRSNRRLHVEVADDGPGFDANRVPDGHGLALLRARLGMTFGDEAALAITSRPGHTVVALDLPFRDSGPGPHP